MGDKSPKSKEKKNKQVLKGNAPKPTAAAVPVPDAKKVDGKGIKK